MVRAVVIKKVIEKLRRRISVTIIPFQARTGTVSPAKSHNQKMAAVARITPSIAIVPVTLWFFDTKQSYNITIVPKTARMISGNMIQRLTSGFTRLKIICNELN